MGTNRFLKAIVEQSLIKVVAPDYDKIITPKWEFWHVPHILSFQEMENKGFRDMAKYTHIFD